MHNCDSEGNPLLDHFNFRLCALAHHHLLMLHWGAPHLSPFEMEACAGSREPLLVVAPSRVLPRDVTLVEGEEG